MGTFVLKRKLYAEDPNNKSGMGLGTKLALGAATVGGSLYGAKKGMFGNTARMAVNKQIMKAGQALGSKSIVKSGAIDYAKGDVNRNLSRMKKINPNFKMTDEEIKKNIEGQSNFLQRQYKPKPANTTPPA